MFLSIKQTVSFLIAIYLLLSSVQAMAATQTDNGITVSPALAIISVNSGDTEKSANIGVNNNNSFAVSLVSELRAVDESGGILVPTKALDERLQETIYIDKTKFSLEPDESTDIKITVINSSVLSPGGTYMALVIRQVGSPDNIIGVQSAIGAGIFITKQQGASRKLTAESFAVKQFMLQEPRKASVIFKNEGNVHLVPRGVVVTTNSDNTEYYQKGVVNQESLTIFPSKTLKFDIPLLTVQKSLFPERQKVILQYRFDGTDEIKAVEKTIWYIPFYWYLIGIGLVVFIIIGIRYLKKRKSSITKTKVAYKTPSRPVNNEHKIVKLKQKKIVVHDQNDGEKIPVRKE